MAKEEQGATSRKSLLRPSVSYFQATIAENDGKEEKQTKVLADIKHCLPRDARMQVLSKASKTFRENTRLQRLLDARRKQFSGLPEEEQRTLRNCFLVYDTDGSGTLDAKELKKCLGELGLKGKGDAEKKEIFMLCQEISAAGDIDFYTFCFELVPKVRQKLQEIRRGPLFEQFCAYDADHSGLLDEVECQEIVRKLCQTNMDNEGFEEIHKHFLELFGRSKQKESGQVDFEAFQQLVGLVREKYQRVKQDRLRMVIQVKALADHEIGLHKEELLDLHESFSKQDHDGSGGLDAQEVVGALLEHGLMPRDPDDRSTVEDTVKELVEAKGDGGMDFHDFLWLIRHVREECRKGARQDLKTVFSRFDKDKSGNLSLCEVSMLIAEIGLTPRCREDQDEIKKLLSEVDADGSGELDFEEFQELVQKITEKLRSGQRRRENETAKVLGFSSKQVSELRDAFFQLDDDGNGQLSIDECRQTLTILRKNMTSEELHDLFSTIDRDGSGEIDFGEFLHFMRTIEGSDYDMLKKTVE